MARAVVAVVQQELLPRPVALQLLADERAARLQPLLARDEAAALEKEDAQIPGSTAASTIAASPAGSRGR